MPNSEDPDASKKLKDGYDGVGFPAERQSQERVNHPNAHHNDEVL